MTSPTAEGPMLHLPLPSRLLLAVGNVMVGPAPQINLLDLDGDRKNVGLMSPIPAALSTCGNSEGWLMMGVIMRAIRFQFSVRWRGITGWTLRTYTIRSLLPAPKLKLFWKGTLMRSATGFWVFLASSDSLS